MLITISESKAQIVIKFQSAGFGGTTINTAGTTTKHSMAIGAIASQGAGQSNQSGFFWGNPDFRPAVQASSITFTSLGSNQYTLNWTNGNGIRRLVVGKASNAVSAIVSSGTYYSANAAFGSGTEIGASSGNFVVYEGTGTSVTVTNLTPSLVYHFKVFEYNGKYAANNANIEYQTSTATGNPWNRTSLALIPTTPSSAIVFSNVTKNQNTISWTNGNGTKRLLVAKQSSAVNASPVNGQGYSSNTTFGSGADLGASNFVSYDGSTNQATVTNLLPNTVYHYQVIEYKGTGADNNFLLASAPLSSQLTLTVEPIATSGTSITQSAFSANWQSTTGAGNYHIDVSDDPGFSSFVPSYLDKVITGGALTVGVNSLNPGTNYYYRIRSENAAGQSGNSNAVAVLTVPASPLVQTSTSIATTSFTTNWSASMSAIDYFVDVATDANFIQLLSLFSNKQLNGTSLDVTGLVSGTKYFIRVRAKNSSGTSPDQPSGYEQITINDAPVIKDPSNAQSASFKANWQPVTGIVDDYEAIVSKLQDFSTIAFQQGGITNTNQIIQGLDPATIYYYKVRARNAGGYSAYSTVESVLTLNADGTILNPPTVSHGASTISSVVANHSGGVGNLSLTINHRPIATNLFVSEPTQAVTGSSTTIPVSNSWLDEMGMEYYYVIADAGGRKDSTGSGFIYKSFTNEPISSLSGIGNGDYRMFSIPAKGESSQIDVILQSVFSALGAYDKTNWRLFHYQGGKYVEFQAGLSLIEPGNGYWITTKENLSSVPFSGTVVPNNQANPFKIQFSAGWNQIGNPYPFNIDWNQIKAANPSVGLNSLWVRENEYTKKDVLAPWKGAFVFSDNGGQVNFPILAKTSSSGRTKGDEPQPLLDEATWRLPIILQLGGITQVSGVGMHPEANLSKDRFDEITIPRFIDYLEMNTTHKEFFAPQFATDVVPTSKNYSWLFSVSSNLSEKRAILSWDHEELRLVQSSIVLLDLSSQALTDMKSVGTYEFVWHEGAQFKILYSREGDLLPGITLLGNAFPNPFTKQVSIPFLLETEQSEVEVVLFDLIGRKVRSLKQQNLKAGIHHMEWDGSNEQGQSVDGGLYLYQLRAAQGILSPAKRIVRR